MPWFALEIFLLGAFEWRELSNLLDSTRTDRVSEEEDPVLVIGIAHQAARERTRFARAMARQLDLRFRDYVEAAHDADPDVLGETLGATCLACPEKVAGVAWGLARDPRPASDVALDKLLTRVHGASLWQFMQRRPRRRVEGTTGAED